MAVLTPVQVAIGGTNPNYAAAAGGGDKVIPNDRLILCYRNASGAPITVTVVVPGNTKYGQAQPDVAVVVPAGGDRSIGPFPSDLADPTDGYVAITYSGVGSLTVAAITI